MKASTVVFIFIIKVVVAALPEVSKEKDIKINDKKIDEKEVHFGWPNFFNPEKSIINKLEEASKKKKASAGDKSSILDRPELGSAELLEENRLINKIKDTDGWREEWTKADYKIKDGLRGTFVMLNDSSEVDSNDLLTDEELGTIKLELNDEYDVYEKLSEKTDDGLRLATPLFRQRYSKSLAKYGAEITYFDGDESVSFVYFGNWCGRGGRIAPVDNIDQCCLERAKCYGRQVARCPDIWKKPYATMYAWTLVNNQHFCVRSEATCINEVCTCDLKATTCIKNSIKRREIVESLENASEDYENNDYSHEDLDSSEEF